MMQRGKGLTANKNRLYVLFRWGPGKKGCKAKDRALLEKKNERPRGRK